VNFDYYWATSRVIRDTINEFPFWSFLFADLHAHVMVMPLTMTFVALMMRWVRSRVMSPPEPLPRSNAVVLLGLLALTLGAITTTNTWSTPTYVLLLAYTLATVWLTESEHRGPAGYVLGFLVRVLLVTVVVVALAYVLFWPYWATFVAPDRNFGWERLPPWKLVQPLDLWTIFGTFLVILVPFLLRQWGELLRSPDGSWTGPRVAGWVVAGILPIAGFAISTRTGMAALFLLADLLAERRGSVRDELVAAPAFPQLDLLAGGFLLAAIATTGLPPLSGFLGKVWILDVLRAHPVWPWLWAAILATSLLAVLAFARAGSLLFWKSTAVGATAEADPPPRARPALPLVATAVLVAAPVLLAASAGPIARNLEATAAQLHDRAAYVEAVLGPQRLARAGEE
jgi:uncharacterized membrane protein